MRRPLPDRLIRTLTRGLSALTLVAALDVTRAGAVPFVEGDLYLVTNSMGNSASGIMHIAMPSGSATVLHTFPAGGQMLSNAVYDAFRDRIIYTHSGSTGPQMIDATGVVTPLGPGLLPPNVLASRGDGLVYLWFHFGDGTDGFFYVDGGGVQHDLLNVAGTGRYVLGSGRYFGEMIYEPITNSLVGLTHSGLASPCADPSQVCVARIPLTPNGRQVAGSMITTQFNVSATPEGVVGASYANGGDILVTVDTNAQATEPRMTMLHPLTMTTSTFASNSNFFSAATNAGVFSHVLGQAVIDDTGANVLLSFSSGEVSAGTVIATGVSGGGTNESARLIEIGRHGVTLDVPRRAARGELALAAVPNPVTVSTTLTYMLRTEQSASLVIRDLAGRTVRTLVPSQLQSAGEHRVAWDGRDAAGARVRPGVYSAVLLGADARGVRPVIVLR